MQVAMAVVCCQSFENIACIGFLYVLMRECQTSAGFAIYNARSIGQVSKLCLCSASGVRSGRVQAARTLDR